MKYDMTSDKRSQEPSITEITLIFYILYTSVNNIPNLLSFIVCTFTKGTIFANQKLKREKI